MHLSSLTLKGFKSFPERTALKFGPGVSVIVGPNGSGKSNITDAVLWALGEQSPLAVRGQSMQDVIFAGGHGIKASSAAEVEVVLDNSDGGVDIGFGEVSITRRIDRNGEGEYRLNGARCRLIDVIELLADTGLGKEMHSVVSQGRVEAIITSKPRDRRMLIEEAAGLGKHRRRRRRAQLKLTRTQDNLDRVLDIEREARSHLRPLKRQAEAAELHARLARQTEETRFELVRDDLRAQREELSAAEAQVAQARCLQGEIEQELKRVAGERERAEQEISSRGALRETLISRSLKARHLTEQLSARLSHSSRVSAVLAERVAADTTLIERFSGESDGADQGERFEQTITELESELERLEQQRLVELEKGLADLQQRRTAAVTAREECEDWLKQVQQRLLETKQTLEQARSVRQEAERSVDSARREAAKIGSALAAVNQFLRTHLDTPAGHRALADRLSAETGYELALAAVLGRALSAATVENITDAGGLLDRAGSEGGSALVLSAAGGSKSSGDSPPALGAQPLIDYVNPDQELAPFVKRLLGDTWVVADLAEVPESFSGTAVTKEGRVWFGSWGELVQVPEGGADRILAARNRRDALIAETEQAAQAEQRAGAAVEDAVQAEQSAANECHLVEEQIREARSALELQIEEERLVSTLIQRRKEAPDEGPLAVRRAELLAELTAARQALERFRREQDEQRRVVAEARERVQRLKATAPLLEGLQTTLKALEEVVAGRARELEQELAEYRRESDELSARLRTYAGEETKLQQRLHATSEQVTTAEVGAQRIRDREVETVTELAELAERLGLAPEPLEQPIDSAERERLTTRLERLARRREQLGPVNPLAKDEYAEALAHVEELETQRSDLEAALSELRSLIRETDRRIREAFEETFTAAASNFEEMVGHLFPGGRGKLSLVREERNKEVSEGQTPEAERSSTEEVDLVEDDDSREVDPEEFLGVEIELTPAGKSAKRLSLLSGGEKALTALSFLFAVFLARPCPFYILDEVEAALDDVNISRFLTLLERFSDRAQFIVVTHQKSTMDAADYLYGVSMGRNGVSKVISRRMPERIKPAATLEVDEDAPITVRDERDVVHAAAGGDSA